jgi:tetratricopeptide (TPR) repeat protein
MPNNLTGFLAILLLHPSPLFSLVQEKERGELVSAVQAQANLTCDWLDRQELAEPTVERMKLVVRQHVDESTWTGKHDGLLFAIVAKHVKSESKVKQKLLVAHVRRTHSIAVQELLAAKSLLGAFESTGLSDPTTLRKALTEAKLTFEVKGKARLLQSNSQAVDSRAISFVLADESQLVSHLTEAPQLEIVRASYRNVMHKKARTLMKTKDWKNALLLWHHLHKRKLVSPELYLDAAKCFANIGKSEEAIQVLQEAFAAYRSEKRSSFFEEIGNQAIEAGSVTGDKLAIGAYERASELLR